MRGWMDKRHGSGRYCDLVFNVFLNRWSSRASEGVRCFIFGPALIFMGNNHYGFQCVDPKYGMMTLLLTGDISPDMLRIPGLWAAILQFWDISARVVTLMQTTYGIQQKRNRHRILHREPSMTVLPLSTKHHGCTFLPENVHTPRPQIN